MKTKLEMAHEFSMKLVGNPTTPLKDLNSIMEASWRYADTMQAEAEKRENKETCDKSLNIDSKELNVEEWQPDWSQAPEWANFIVMSKAGTAYWHNNKPKTSGNGWVGGGLCDLAYMDFYHKGDWRDSLRKRTE